ncbi:MAG TPA: sulfatase-like hydrolase/transferase [Solirubrobacteraceae bacterium]|nr:sulfatase-like hydrolase/transferase [Solirubrobacteraceae bacterium]
MNARAPALVVVLGALAVTLVLLTTSAPHHGKKLGRTAPDPRPNIVFVLTDDLDWSLVNRRYMPHVVALERRGETFSHYFVADSLCCPSRATIFTGNFPHDTRVFSNFGSRGGFQTPATDLPRFELPLGGG